MSKKCLDCKGKLHCCVGGFTFVGLSDAKKIKKYTKLEYDSFLDFSKLSKTTLDLLKIDDPSLEGSLRYTQLHNNKILRLKKEKKKCVFFENKKCQIYEIRPNICKIYPYWVVKLINGRLKVIEHDSYNFCRICDVDKLSKKEEAKIKKIFNKILKEAKNYRVNIKSFVKKHA